MKQSAVKTLGVAALGAAFAVTAAGAATAAPSLPDPAAPLDTVTSAVPVQETLTKLPAGAPESLTGGQAALTESVSTVPGTLQGAANRVAKSPTDPVTSLLGGLPVGDLTAGVPLLGGPGH
ncbi:ATP-binding protein [Streptomyces sp. NPDC055078]